jgi:hypothetical protein
VTAEIEAEDLVLCPGESTVLSAVQGDYAYIWQPGGESTPNINISSPGLYSLTTFNELGCEETTSIVIAGEDMASPITSSVSVCLGDSALLVAQSLVPVFWSYSASGSPILAFGDTLIVPEVNAPQLIYAFSGDETCYSDPTPAVLNVDPSSLAPSIGQVGLECTGGSLELIVQSPLTGVNYLWTLPDDSTFYGNSFLIDSLSSFDTGAYMVQVISEVCQSAITELFVEVLPPSLVEIVSLPENVLCEGDSFTLTADDSLWTDFTWIGPGVVQYGLSTLQFDSVGLSDMGLYSVTATDTVGCAAVGSAFLTVIPYPIVDLDSALQCIDGFLYAILEEGYSSYLWSNGVTESEVLISDDGLWTVEVVNQGLCAISDSILITDETCIDEMMNIITPNGDGENDELDFNVMGMNLDRVEIYSRLGNSIKVLSEPFVWDGRTEAGVEVSEGVYYWVAFSGEEPTKGLTKTGYLHVLR